MSDKIITLRHKLESKGISQEIRTAIRSSKICIIDDQISDLKSMTSALKKEGFNNIIEMNKVVSIESILNERFDLIVLDLGGVATEISKDDGYGVLARLKELEPALPILVITGSTTPPDKLTTVNKADLIRSKPVYPAELASDVDLILKTSKDEFWAGIELLTELIKINHKIMTDLPLFERIKLYFHKRAIIKKITNEDKDIIANIIKISRITAKLGSASLKISRIAHGLGA